MAATAAICNTTVVTPVEKYDYCRTTNCVNMPAPPPPPSGSDGPVYNSVPGLGVSMQLSIAGICLVQETREQGKKKAAD